jgi:DNA-binding NtrC family response regulator
MEIPSIRVLLVEDDKEDYILLRDMLTEIKSSRFDLQWANTYKEGMRYILGAEWDVCLVDFRLGEEDGLDFLREATIDGCEAPIILLTGHGGYDVDIEAMEAGAADYLVKGQISPDLLDRSIRYSIAQKQRDLELRRYRDHLEHLVRERTRELEETLANMKVLKGLLPICAWCKKIRDDKGYWRQLESFIRDHSEADFSHSICPVCARKARNEWGDQPD